MTLITGLDADTIRFSFFFLIICVSLSLLPPSGDRMLAMILAFFPFPPACLRDFPLCCCLLPSSGFAFFHCFAFVTFSRTTDPCLTQTRF